MKRRVAVKRGSAKQGPSQQQQKKRKQAIGDDAFDWSGTGADADVIASDSEDEEAKADGTSSGSESDEEAKETAQEKRMRLAKEYLGTIAAQQEQSGSEDDDDFKDGVEDRIGARLHQDALEAMGKLFREVASKFEDFEFDADSTQFLKGHRVRLLFHCHQPI